MDVSFGQGVSVVVDGEQHAAPLAMAGCCVGEGATVGAGVQVAAGRCIPAGLAVVPGLSSTVIKVPEGLTGLAMVVDGSLEPR